MSDASVPSHQRKFFQFKNANMHVCQVVSVVSNSLQPYGPWPARLLCPRGFSRQNAGVGCHALLQGIFTNPGIEPASPALQVDSLPLKPSSL